MELKKDTICVQGGWQPKNGEPRVLPILSEQLRSAMRQAKRWENCLIWRRRLLLFPFAESDLRYCSTENL